MLGQVLVSPIAIVRALRWRTAALVACTLLVTLATNLSDRRPFSLRRHPAFYLALILSATTAGILFAVMAWWPLESAFRTRPWARAVKPVPPEHDGPQLCPYTGNAANRKCTVCGVWVSLAAWHEADTLMRFPYGSYLYDVIELDRAFRQSGGQFNSDLVKDVYNHQGNYLVLAFCSSCVGCFVHQRAWGALPRLAISSGLLSIAGSVLPHAFDAKYMPFGFRVVLDIIAMFFAVASVFLTLESIASTLWFVIKYPQFKYPDWFASLNAHPVLKKLSRHSSLTIAR